MSFFRLHIIKVSVLIIFITGLIFLFRADKGSHANAVSVSTWLLELRADTTNEVLQQKIYSLASEEKDINRLLQEASALVSEYPDDFKIPISGENPSHDEIYNTLVLKWSHHHQQAATTNAIMATDRVIPASSGNDNEENSIRHSWVQTVNFVLSTYGRVVEVWEYILLLLRPFATGIVINAP